MVFSVVSFFLAAQIHADLPKSMAVSKPKPDQVVAKVNGQSILAKDVEPYLWDWATRQVAKELAAYSILKSEAAKRGIALKNSEIETAYQEKIKGAMAQVGPGKTLRDVLGEQQYSPSRIYLAVKAQLLLDKMVDQGFDAKEFINISTIQIKPATEQMPALSAAIQRADEAFAKLNKGEAWIKVLKEYDNTPGSEERQGKIGWRKISAFPKSVQEELKKLKIGGITKPAQTPNGIQIFKVEGIGAEAKGADLEEVRNLYRSFTQGQIFDKLRQTMKVEFVWPK